MPCPAVYDNANYDVDYYWGCDPDMTVPDAVRQLLTLIGTNWDSDNTDSKVPRFLIITDPCTKRIDSSDGNDYVLFYLASKVSQVQGLGANRKQVHERVTVDVRTAASRERSQKLINEVERVLDLNIATPNPTSCTNNYCYLLPEDFLDLSDKMSKLWRWTLDVQMVRLAAARGA